MKKISLFGILLILTLLTASADNEWLHIYSKPAGDMLRVESHPADSISEINYTGTVDGSFDKARISMTDGKVITRDLSSIGNVVVGSQVPTVFIDIANGAEVIDKSKYLKAEIRVEGNGIVPDRPLTSVSIKGRGNSTWSEFPKKPWRLKFSKKISLCGLANAKNYALIANFIDPSHMRNTIAFRIAQMLDMPWTNHSIPVNIVMNGTYRGLYMLTEKVGIDSSSVDIDETQGILWECDLSYDEDFRFMSSGLNLPVMIKDPDLAEIAEDDPSGITADELFSRWRADFERLEAAVTGTSGEDWVDLLDVESAAKYVFVNALTGNHEPTWPKSVYLYKETPADKYKFGPVWDFDWAYTLADNAVEGAGKPTTTWLGRSQTAGAMLFRKICSDSRFRDVFRRIFERFYLDQFDDLLDYIDEYADLIRPAAYHNGERWPAGCEPRYPYVGSSEQFDLYLEQTKDFLRKRIEAMHKHSTYSLY